MTNLKYDEAATEQLEAIYRGPDIVGQRAQTLRLLDLKPGESVIDIGSGPGFLCTQMAEMVGASGRVRGVDISPVMVDRASRRNPDRWISFAVGDATSLPDDDATYDAVVSIQVAEYVADIGKFCREALRVLKPGGRALIMATDWDSIAWYSTQPDRMRRVLSAFAPHCADSALPRTLGTRLREAGFALGRVTPYPILNTAWTDDSYSCRVIPFITSYVRRQKTVPDDELDAWAAEQADLGRRGFYYFLSCRVFFQASKPR
ncbi:MAG: methyltransferase domain-containing protein [Hyphomicrobiales bacterium]